MVKADVAELVAHTEEMHRWAAEFFESTIPVLRDQFTQQGVADVEAEIANCRRKMEQNRETDRRRGYAMAGISQGPGSA